MSRGLSTMIGSVNFVLTLRCLPPHTPFRGGVGRESSVALLRDLAVATVHVLDLAIRHVAQGVLGARSTADLTDHEPMEQLHEGFVGHARLNRSGATTPFNSAPASIAVNAAPHT